MHKLCIVNPKNVPNGTLSEHNHAIYLRETFFELIPGKVIIFQGSSVYEELQNSDSTSVNKVLILALPHVCCACLLLTTIK